MVTWQDSALIASLPSVAKKEMRAPIETGAPDGFQYMHPTMRKNFGQWQYHEHPRPGVLVHVAKSGEEIWTVPSWIVQAMNCEKKKQGWT